MAKSGDANVYLPEAARDRGIEGLLWAYGTVPCEQENLANSSGFAT